MQKYGVNELRRMFLEFFESKEHLAMKSFSLVPHNDNSLLLINSGMAPLKPYFTGQEIPPRRRVTTCQKCIRTGDIENIMTVEVQMKINTRCLFLFQLSPFLLSVQLYQLYFQYKFYCKLYSLFLSKLSGDHFLLQQKTIQP